MVPLFMSLAQQLIEEKDSPEVTLSHPKAKEWIVAMAKASYQELAKLASDDPVLVKLQVSTSLKLINNHLNLVCPKMRNDKF